VEWAASDAAFVFNASLAAPARCMGLLDNLKSLFDQRLQVQSRYELLREAISGTMSNFYMARDKQTGMVVGLKILDPQKTAEFEERFRGLKKPNEGTIAKAIDHPNVVKVYDHGVTSKGQPYIVMEYLDGPGLNSMIVGRHPALEANLVTLLRQAAESLSAVHKAGFIHRDVCPRNYVVARDSKSLKLIDFGLAVPDTPEFRQPGNRTGTANYMAPEVVRRKKTDHRLDVFAFGVTAFEMCTFELPWPRGDGQDALLHDTQEPVDIRKLRPNIEPRLAEAIMKCLAPLADQRPPSMDHFLRLIVGVKKTDA
jgi:serine/threonine-protein kinase